MSNQKSFDHIGKASRILVESIKDTVSANVVATSQQLEIKGEALAKLTTILSASIEDGYHKAYCTFLRMIESAEQQLVPTPVPTTKKKTP